jgi:hypothetical protein
MSDPPNSVNINDSFEFILPISKMGQERQTGPGSGIGIPPGIWSCGIRSHNAGTIRHINRGLRSNIVGRPNGSLLATRALIAMMHCIPEKL